MREVLYDLSELWIRESRFRRDVWERVSEGLEGILDIVAVARVIARSHWR